VILWKTSHSASEGDITTTAPGSIDPARFLHDQLESAPPDLLRQMLATFINALMSAEADAVCGAPYGIPDPDRVNVRTGYRRRDSGTRAGTLDVAIPEAAVGVVLPRLAAGTPPPRRSSADQRGGGRIWADLGSWRG
jgi:Transposase, Mutator family